MNIGAVGIVMFLIAGLALAAGFLRNELVLFLAAAVSGAVWVYCLVFTLLFALLNSRRARAVSLAVGPAQIVCGGETALRFRGPRFFRFPAILVRCRLNLETKDGRVFRRVFDPRRLKNETDYFRVWERGAYYSPFDEVLVMDSLGFFTFAFRLKGISGTAVKPRLLVSPYPLAEAAPVHMRSGGEEHRTDTHYRRTDNLIEHKPYIPGDDPRRINWKLYSRHGELFVRQGEREPPPHSRLTILVDTQVDASLYTARRGREAVDMVCAYALRAALDCAEKGMELRLGWPGGSFSGSTPEELAAALAYPAAASMKSAEEFDNKRREPAQRQREQEPGADADRGVLILALPRSRISENSALETFLRKRSADQQIELLFLYGENDSAAASAAAAAVREAAASCAALYGGRAGVTASAAAVAADACTAEDGGGDEA